MAIYNNQIVAGASNQFLLAYNSVSSVLLYPAVSGDNGSLVVNYNNTDLGFPITSGSSAVNITTTWGEVLKVLVYNNGTLQAAATAAISGTGTTAGVSAVTVGTQGFGYRAAPTVTFTAPATGTNTATGTAALNTATGAVTGVTITNPGSGYASAPSVALSAPLPSTITFLVTDPGSRQQNTVTIGFNGSKAASSVTVTNDGIVNSTPEQRRLRLLGYI